MWPQSVSKVTQVVAASGWAMRLSALGLRLRSGIHESATLFPAATRERHLLVRWIVSARSAHIALLAALLINIFVMPPTRDALLDVAFSKESLTEKVGGVFGADSKWDHRRAAASRLITITSWCTGVGTALLLLWLHLPAAVRRKNDRPSSSASPAATTVKKRYRLEAQIGRGASGIVHRAMDTVLDRKVALKELAMNDADADTVARFRREAKTVAQLNHPNIVQVYDLVDHGGKVWIAMELVESGDLSSVLKQEGRLPVESATRIAHAIAQAIACAHDHDIVHRDLKPQNVLIDVNGAVKVTDFGLAKLAHMSTQTIEGTILGSPHYMSPEQADGKPADHRADVYSLGTILFHMLAGRPPFEGELTSVLMQHIRRPAPRPSDVVSDLDIPTELEMLLLQMLAKDPTQRPQSMHEAAQQLASYTVARV